MKIWICFEKIGEGFKRCVAANVKNCILETIGLIILLETIVKYVQSLRADDNDFVEVVFNFDASVNHFAILVHHSVDRALENDKHIRVMLIVSI